MEVATRTQSPADSVRVVSSTCKVTARSEFVSLPTDSQHSLCGPFARPQALFSLAVMNRRCPGAQVVEPPHGRRAGGSAAH